jgi:hypothetical protein
MVFNLATAASLLTLCAFATSAAIEQKSPTEDGKTLYAYGTREKRYDIFYANGRPTIPYILWKNLTIKGLAYFGNSSTYANTISNVVTDVTFKAGKDNTSVPWSIAPQNSTVTFPKTMTLYIVPASGSFQQVGFASSSDLPDGAVNMGFAFFGTQVAYVQSTSNWQMSFWGNSTTTSGVWALYWNGGGDDNSLPGSFPVVVKTTPPTYLHTIS